MTSQTLQHNDPDFQDTLVSISSPHVTPLTRGVRVTEGEEHLAPLRAYSDLCRRFGFPYDAVRQVTAVGGTLAVLWAVSVLTIVVAFSSNEMLMGIVCAFFLGALIAVVARPLAQWVAWKRVKNLDQVVMVHEGVVLSIRTPLDEPEFVYEHAGQTYKALVPERSGPVPLPAVGEEVTVTLDGEGRMLGWAFGWGENVETPEPAWAE